MQRRLWEVGLKAYRARKKPRLTLAHRQKRLEFARKHRYWSASDCSRVVFSDESRFLLYRNDGRPYVRRRPGEAYRDDCVQPTLKHGGGSLMVWGCMSESGVGELDLVKGRLCASDYIWLFNGPYQQVSDLRGCRMSTSSSRTMPAATPPSLRKTGWHERESHSSTGPHKVLISIH